MDNFVECSSNRTLSAVFYTKLQSNKKSNQSESGDKINGVSIAFRGNLKFGPLRFDDVNIELRMQNTELSIKGDYREITPKHSGIFKSAPLEPQLYISRVESGSSMGSFQSLVNFLGIEKRVNVSFSRNGLTFNVSGKLHGLYDAFIRFDSPLTSWESQTFVAAGEFVKKSDGLVEALDKALHAFGVDVFNRATRRVASFKLRKERAYTRLENTLAFEKTRRQEMDKAREDFMTAERRLEAAKKVLKNLEGNVSARLKNLTSQLNKFCHMKQCSDVCRKGMVCRNCNYNIAAESRETCLATCFKTEQRVITSNVSSVLCKTQDCTRIYLKSSLSKVNLRNTLASITKEVFSYAMKPTDFFLNNLPQAGTDARSAFFPGNTNEAVCTTQMRNVDGNLKGPVLSNPFQDTVMSNSNSERPCETDRRDGQWKCRVHSETCKKSETGFQYEYHQKPYACERLCEVYVSNETIPKSCCSTVPCAFRIVNVTCVAENALCHKIRIDALEKIPSIHNDSTEMLKNLESARANVSYWEIMKRRAAIRLSSASNAFNMSEKAVRNLRKAYNITVQSQKNISNILAQPLRLKELVNKRLKSVEFVEFQSVKFNVKVAAIDESAVLPVRIMFKLNGSEEELSAVLNFRNFNASLRSIVKDILSMYMRVSTGKVRRKRSAEDKNSSFAEPSNRLKETNYLTVSTLQKYHKLCSEFTIYEQALYDIVLSLYNITSESRQLVQEANIRNVSGLFDAIGILEKLIGNETIASKFGSETGKTAYLNSLETDPVLLGALDLQNEAAKDGFEPVNLTSKLLFRNWYSTMENIFNVVLRNCSGFDDCVTYVLDGLTEIYEVTDLPGADNVRQQVREVRTNLVKLIESVDLSIDDAANISSNTLRILQDMTKAKLFCGRLPNITKHPEPLTEIGEAQTLVLSCNATGEFLVYKWRFNGNILDEQTTSVLLIRNTTPSQSGNYTCEVSNYISKETSSPALVIIHPPPSIILQPVDHLSVVLSVNESLQCVAESSENSISYQWWFKSLDSTSYLPLAREIFSHLNFAPMEARYQGRYFCNVSNSFGYSISKTSFVKALYFTLPVPVATLSLSLTRKPGVNATFLQRTQTLPFAQIQLEISELLLVASGNVSNASKPQIKDLRITSCQLIKARDEQTRDIAEVCQWKFDYVGKNVTSNSSINDMFEANAQKVITSTRGINSAILRLTKGTNKGGLSFDAGSERYILEPHSLGVETFTLMCSPGQKLIKEDFRCGKNL